MDLAGTLLRATDQCGAVYPPYSFVGPWTDEEKSAVIAELSKPDRLYPNQPRVPTTNVEATFNEWAFVKLESQFRSCDFMAQRATWYDARQFGSLDALTAFLDVYYSR